MEREKDDLSGGGASMSLADLAAFAHSAWRRIGLLAIVAAVLSAGVFAIVLRMPDVYVARSTVHIEAARLPKSFERAGAVVPKLNELVGLFRKEILSRDVLREVINDLGLYDEQVPVPVDLSRPLLSTMDGAPAAASRTAAAPVERPTAWRQLFHEDLIARAARDIQIDIRGEYIELSVRARRPDLAVRAVNRVADLLERKNRELRVKRAQNVLVFLDIELAKAARRVQDDEAALLTFRDATIESLPENEGRLLERLYTLKMETMDRRHSIEQANTRRDAIEAKLGSSVATDGVSAEAEARLSLEYEVRQLEMSERQLVARGRKPGHPDLQRVRAQIDTARKRLIAMGGSPGGTTNVAALLPPGDAGADPRASGGAGAIAESDTPEKLTADLAVLTRTVQNLTREQEQALKEIERIDGLKSQLGTTRTKLLKLEAALKESDELHRALLQERRDLERFLVAADAMQGDKLRTIDAAELPTAPEEPNRVLLLLAGVAVSLVAGTGLAIVVDRFSGTFRTAADVEAELMLPVLATLPDLDAEPSAAALAAVRGGRA
jgi:succinoglycan biosynthesis transport protein ExoP